MIGGRKLATPDHPLIKLRKKRYLQVSAESWFSTQSVKKVRHNAKTCEGKYDRCRSHKARKEKPVGVVVSRKHGTDGKVDPHEHVYVPFEEPMVGLHEVQRPAPFPPRSPPLQGS